MNPKIKPTIRIRNKNSQNENSEITLKPCKI